MQLNKGTVQHLNDAGSLAGKCVTEKSSFNPLMVQSRKKKGKKMFQHLLVPTFLATHFFLNYKPHTNT